MPKSNPLPKFLIQTPERVAKIAEQQTRLRTEAQQRGRLSPEARRMQIGMAHETAARTDVEMLEGEVRNPPNKQDYDTRLMTVARLGHARERLAEALAHQGRYDEAAALSTARAGEYETLWEAVHREDDETCPCEPLEDGHTHDHIAEHIISQKHDGKLIPAVKCNACGFLNVRSLPHDLRRLEELRAQAKSAMHGASAADLKHRPHEIIPEHLRRVPR
jgi:hypothetical protein